ncbi:SDR family oxidoreductase [Oceanicoccus sagamiensis]|uniref:3-oxoacyl-ACP reductase n=1 Tax=Oceanicoccus sagamiensis TaxID=716816 RepID=A0A1X9NDN8_9GAMM|nr:SDR family oxidoreductase [Oceanicoccus sagamiensis]ARN75271.1 3-oxoacyl-ACP reductase [Oceanicoccus sagamiensis]
MSASDLSLQNLFSLTGKVALVTGGSKGIGRMIAQGLLQAGAKVYISARKADECQQVAEELSAFGDCVAIASDVTLPESRQQLIEQLSARESQLNILVNNAGSAWGASYEEYPEAAFDKLMAINVKSVFALSRDLTPLMEQGASKDDPARIVNIGSVDGLHIATAHNTGMYAYSASKAAVHHLTRHLAVELGKRQITVNAVAPGFFPSKMTGYLFDTMQEKLEANSLLGRVGRDEEMAGIAIYLCSKAGAYTHGTVIPVDGGTSINHQHLID